VATSLRNPPDLLIALRTDWLAFVVTAFLVMRTPAVVCAVDEAAITRVEEDWQVEIATPNASEYAPQITTVISPHANLDHAYAKFKLNNAAQPRFEAGDLQIQCWCGDSFPDAQCQLPLWHDGRRPPGI
jgi:hypothetical protein